MKENEDYKIDYPGLGVKNIWVTEDGRTLSLKEMSIEHLHNTYHVIENLISKSDDVSDKTDEICAELEKRGECVISKK